MTTIHSSTDLLAELRQLALLPTEQLDEADRALLERFTDARQLARELVQRGWLTPFQVNQLVQGRAKDLRLGPYVLLERLGEGGMGQVYKARHQQLDRVVALKVIRSERLASADAVQRFQREAKAVARLAHPNIVLVYDAGSVNGLHYLAMEFIEGIDLQRLLKKGPLPVAAACDYARQAVLGLQHAYERGLVHRDIKPANLMLAGVRSQGSGVRNQESPCRDERRADVTPDSCPLTPVLKVLDFGLALINYADTSVMRGAATVPGMVMGTPDYMAPEQSCDAHKVDIRADLYSLGCTLYHLLTGQPPFPGDNWAEKLSRHLSAAPQPVEQLRPEVPVALASVVHKLMAKRPEDRYPTPQAAADALTLFANATSPKASPQPLAVSPPSPHSETLSFAPTSPALTPPSAPTAPLADSFLAPPNQGANAPRSPARRKLLYFAGAAVVLLGFVALLTWSLTRNDDPENTGSNPGAGAAPNAGDPKPGLAGLNRAQIPPDELVDGLPPDVVAVLGEHRWRHFGAVHTVTFSPDGKQVASAGEDGVIHIRDADTGRTVQSLRGHTAPVRCVRFAPDNSRTLASGGVDKTVRVWDLTQGREKFTLIDHKATVNALAFNRFGTLLASGGFDTLKVWNAGNGTLKHDFEGRMLCSVESLAFSHDGGVLASGGMNRGSDVSIYLWNPVTAEPIPFVKRHIQMVSGVAFNKDATRITYGGGYSLLFTKEVATEKPVSQIQLDGGGGSVSSRAAIALAPNEGLLATGMTKNIQLWNYADGMPGGTLRGHNDVVNTLAFSHDSTRLVSGSADGTVRLWKLHADKPYEAPVLAGHTGPVLSVAVSPDGGTIVTGSQDQTFRLWPLTARGPGEPEVLRSHGDSVTRVIYMQEGRTLLTYGADGDLRLWEMKAGKPTPGRQWKLDRYAPLAVSHDGMRFAYGKLRSGHFADVVIFDVAAGQEIGVFPSGFQSSSVTALAFSADAKQLLLGDNQGSVRMLDPSNPSDAFQRSPDQQKAVLLQVSPDGNTLAVATELPGSPVWLWDAKTLKPKGALRSSSGAVVTSILFAQGGKRVLTADAAGNIHLWDPEFERRLKTWQLPGAVLALALSKDGRHLVTGNSNGTVYVIRLPE